MLPNLTGPSEHDGSQKNGKKNRQKQNNSAKKKAAWTDDEFPLFYRVWVCVMDYFLVFPQTVDVTNRAEPGAHEKNSGKNPVNRRKPKETRGKGPKKKRKENGEVVDWSA